MNNIPTDILLSCRKIAHTCEQPLLSVLEAQLQWTPGQAVEALASAVGLPLLSHAALANYEPAFEYLPFPDASHDQVILVRHKENGSHLLGMPDPLDTRLQARMAERILVPFGLAVIHPAELSTYLADQGRALKAVDQYVDNVGTGIEDDGGVATLDLVGIGRDESPAVRTVNSTLFDALNAGASDIHFEASAKGMAVKYRIDGVLLPATQVGSREIAEQIVSRIKVLAELDIAERRVPQDGKFRVATQDRRIDVRVSIMPSVFGEDAVLRILDRSAISQRFSRLRLEDLGFVEEDAAAIRRLAAEPYGMMLVTGPTGSGKTTTLYAAIGEIHTGRDKVITIEDPVEYHLDGVLQIPVNEKKGLSFARGLRSILRHDPDKILVGEMRDTETAQIAVQSALTGHAVFTTVHANNALDVVGRVVNMGADPYGFLSALNGIVAQRLIRKICRHCSAPDPAQPESGYRIGQGCAECRGTGYRGRRALSEIVVLDDALRAAFMRNDPPAEIKHLLITRGVVFLRQQAMRFAEQGETSLDEVNRVTLAS